MHLYRKLAGSLILLFSTCQIWSQKSLVDSNAYSSWPSFRMIEISNNGNYVFYETNKDNHLFLRSTNGKWKGDYQHAGSPHFTQNSKWLVYQINDSLCLLNLENDQVEYIEGITGSFQLLPYDKNNDILIYKQTKDPDQLHIRQINSTKQNTFPTPEKYWYDTTTKVFTFLTKEGQDENIIYHLKYSKLTEDSITDFWQGPDIKNLVFSEDKTQMFFLTEDTKRERSIWYYNFGNTRPVKLLDDHSSRIDSGLKIENILGLNKDQTRLVFTLTKSTKTAPPPSGVDIWNYRDPKLQSQQLYELGSGASAKVNKATINLADGAMDRLEHENEQIFDSYSHSLVNNWGLLLHMGKGDHSYEWNWNDEAKASVYLLSMKDGKRRLIYTNVAPYCYFTLSPDEKYIVFYDPKKSGYYTFEVSTGIIRNITNGIHTKWTDLNSDWPSAKYMAVGVAGFTKDRRFVLIYDQYDIYKVDLSGTITPVSLTKGYGRSHHIIFKIASGQDKNSFTSTEKIILEAFNKDNKDAGFYSTFLENQNGPDSLTMQPFKFDILAKARDTNSYLLLQQDAKSFPNIVFSPNLKDFTPLSDLHPEKQYNWLTSELVIWRLPSGSLCQGILYKPENFDPHKKYPLIINYYEQISDRLHQFLTPEPSYADINIPFFVSNGYLVFTPDIYYKIGEPGRSAFTTVTSAATALIKRGYIDSGKIGLQGTSFGGFETNYIIAHTNMFAAAMSSSGMTDFVSIYGSIIGNGSSRQRQYELYRDRMGATLWQIPDLYIENSPVLRANLITTPLLMMANKNDADVPYQQGIELFTALRRLRKKVWMLQYDGQGHGLFGKPRNDLTIRQFQFFNYYLKNSLPPKWMTIGVPADRKGIDDGFDLDTSGAKP